MVTVPNAIVGGRFVSSFLSCPLGQFRKGRCLADCQKS